MSLDKLLAKEKLNNIEDKVSYKTIRRIIEDYISEEGPKETTEIVHYLKKEGYEISYDRIRRALHQGNTFSSKKWKYVISEVLEPLGLREPYKKNKNGYVWEIKNMKESEKEKRLINFARKKSKN